MALSQVSGFSEADIFRMRSNLKKGFLMEGHLYRCEECGGHAFIVVHTYEIRTHDLCMLVCTCGNRADAVAAHRNVVIREEYVEWGPLDQEHNWNFEAKNMEELGESHEESHVLCEPCTRKAEKSDWKSIDRYSETIHHEFYLFCQSCEREIEFGWSEPGRGGGIWPVDSSDFDPSRCWPEPRHLGAWIEKGWYSRDHSE